MYDYDRRFAAYTDAITNTREVPAALAALDKLFGNFRTHFGEPGSRDKLERFTKRLRAGKAKKNDVFAVLRTIDEIVDYLKLNNTLQGAGRDATKFRALRRLISPLLAFDPNAPG